MSEQAIQRQTAQNSTLRRFLSRPVGFWLLGAALFLVTFLLGFSLWLPLDVIGNRLAREVERQTSLQLSVGTLSHAPLLALRGRDLTLQGENLLLAPLVIDQVDLGPKWFSLFTADPAVDWQAQLLKGTMEGVFHRSGTMKVAGSKLQLNLTWKAQPTLAATGLLTAGQLVTSLPLQKETASRFELNLDNVQLLGLGIVSEDSDGLLLGTIQLQANGKGRAFKIERLLASGGDVEAKGEGTLLMTGNPQDSLINLSLNLRTTAKTAPEITSLLELIGKRQADGGFLVKLGGTLSSPVMSP